MAVDVSVILIDGLLLSLMYSLSAFGLALIFGMLRIMNFAQGVFFVIGTYFVYYFWNTWGLPYWSVVIINMLIVIPIGWFLYWIFFGRKMESAFGGRVVGIVLISKSLAGIFYAILYLILGGSNRFMPSLINGTVGMLGTSISLERVVVIAVSAGIIAFLVWLLNFTVFGNTIKAMVQQQTAARMVGINPWRMGLIVFILGVCLTTLAGTMMAPVLSVASMSAGGDISSKAVMMVIIGGVGSFQGIIAAGFILGFVEAFVSTLLNPMWASFIGYAMMFTIFIFKPTGLFGEKIEIF